MHYFILYVVFSLDCKYSSSRLPRQAFYLFLYFKSAVAEPQRWCWLSDIPGVCDVCVCACVCSCVQERKPSTLGGQPAMMGQACVVSNKDSISIKLFIFRCLFTHIHAHTRIMSRRASVLVVHLSLTPQNSDVFLWVDGTGYVSMSDGVHSPQHTPHSINLSVSRLSISNPGSFTVSVYILLFRNEICRLIIAIVWKEQKLVVNQYFCQAVNKCALHSPLCRNIQQGNVFFVLHSLAQPHIFFK